MICVLSAASRRFKLKYFEKLLSWELKSGMSFGFNQIVGSCRWRKMWWNLKIISLVSGVTVFCSFSGEFCPLFKVFFFPFHPVVGSRCFNH